MTASSRSLVFVASLAAVFGCGGLAPMDLSRIDFLTPGVPVAGPSGAYTLTPGRAFWKRAPRGALSAGDADLELVGGNDAGAAWVVVFVGRRPDTNLERVVRARRDFVLSQWGLEQLDEERSFWPGAALVPAARGRYSMRAKADAPPELLTTLALETPYAVIEVVGYALRGAPYEAELEALLASFALAEQQTSAPATPVWSRSEDFTPAQVAARAEVELRCDGALREHLVREIGGAPGAALRARLAPLSPAERERWLRDEFRAAVGDEARPRFALDGLAAADGEPVVVRSETLYPTRGRAEGRREIYEPDAWLLHYGNALLGTPTPAAISIESETRYVLCPDVAVPFAGPGLAFRASAGSLLREYALGDAEARVATRLALPPAPEPGARAARDRFLERTLSHTNVWLRLVPRP